MRFELNNQKKCVKPLSKKLFFAFLLSFFVLIISGSSLLGLGFLGALEKEQFFQTTVQALQTGTITSTETQTWEQRTYVAWAQATNSTTSKTENKTLEEKESSGYYKSNQYKIITTTKITYTWSSVTEPFLGVRTYTNLKETTTTAITTTLLSSNYIYVNLRFKNYEGFNSGDITKSVIKGSMVYYCAPKISTSVTGYIGFWDNLNTYALSDKTYVVSWTPKNYKITFTGYNNTGAGSVSYWLPYKTPAYGGLFTTGVSNNAPTIQSRTGYENGTWPTFNEVTGDATYSVVWKKAEYKIVFKNKIGALFDPWQTYSEKTQYYGDTIFISAPSQHQYLGVTYKFSYWKANDGTSFTNSWTVDSSKTFYAQYVAKRTITLNNIDGSGGVTLLTEYYDGDTISFDTIKSYCSALSDKVLDYWTYPGDWWSTQKFTSGYMSVSGDITLTAVWKEKNSVVLTYGILARKLNGSEFLVPKPYASLTGSFSTYSQQGLATIKVYQGDNKTIIVSAPASNIDNEKNCYIFVGWSDGITTKTRSIDNYAGGTKTIYAIYKQTKVKYTYHVVYGTLGGEDKTQEKVCYVPHESNEIESNNPYDCAPESISPKTGYDNAKFKLCRQNDINAIAIENKVFSLKEDKNIYVIVPPKTYDIIFNRFVNSASNYTSDKTKEYNYESSLSISDITSEKNGEEFKWFLNKNGTGAYYVNSIPALATEIAQWADSNQSSQVPLYAVHQEVTKYTVKFNLIVQSPVENAYFYNDWSQDYKSNIISNVYVDKNCSYYDVACLTGTVEAGKTLSSFVYDGKSIGFPRAWAQGLLNITVFAQWNVVGGSEVYPGTVVSSDMVLESSWPWFQNNFLTIKLLLTDGWTLGRYDGEYGWLEKNVFTVSPDSYLKYGFPVPQKTSTNTSSDVFASWKAGGTSYTDNAGNIITDVSGHKQLKINTTSTANNYTFILKNYYPDAPEGSKDRKVTYQGAPYYVPITNAWGQVTTLVECVMFINFYTVPDPSGIGKVFDGYYYKDAKQGFGLNIVEKRIFDSNNTTTYECRWIEDTAEMGVEFWISNENLNTVKFLSHVDNAWLKGTVVINNYLSTWKSNVDGKVGIPAVSIIDEKYAFVGWNDKEDGTGNFYYPTNIIVTKVNLYAIVKQKASSDLVEVRTHDEKKVFVAQTYVSANTLDYYVAPYVVSGKNFLGWQDSNKVYYTDANGNATNRIVAGTKTLNLYPSYNSSMTIKWDLNLAEADNIGLTLNKTIDSAGTSDSIDFAIIGFKSGVSGSAKTESTNIIYIVGDKSIVFTGWTANGKNYAVDATTLNLKDLSSATSPVTVKANWIIKKTINFFAFDEKGNALALADVAELVDNSGKIIENGKADGYIGTTFSFKINVKDQYLYKTKTVKFNNEETLELSNNQCSFAVVNGENNIVIVFEKIKNITFELGEGVANASATNMNLGALNKGFYQDEIYLDISLKENYSITILYYVNDISVSENLNNMANFVMPNYDIKIIARTKLNQINVTFETNSNGSLIINNATLSNKQSVLVIQNTNYDYIFKPEEGYGIVAKSIAYKYGNNNKINLGNLSSLTQLSEPFTFNSDVTIYCEFAKIVNYNFELLCDNLTIADASSSILINTPNDSVGLKNNFKISILENEKMDVVISSLLTQQNLIKYNLTKVQFFNLSEELVNENIINSAPKTLSITASENLNIKILFEEAVDIANLILTVGENGNATVNGQIYSAGEHQIQFSKGKNINVSFVPNNNYVISALLVDGENIEPITSNLLLQNFETDKNISVQFGLDPDYHTITVDVVENGSIIPSATFAKSGEIISLSINANEGYQLKANSLKVLSNNIEQTITNDSFVMPNSSCNVKAEFEKATYTITIQNDLNGNIVTKILDEIVTSAHMGDVVNTEVLAHSDYIFKSGSLRYINSTTNEEIIIENNQFIMPASNIVIFASFEEIIYSITIDSAIENGKITSNKTTAKYGENITLSVLANKFYKLKEGSLKYSGMIKDALGVNSSFETNTINGTDFVMPRGNITITAEFEIYDCNIAISSIGEGSLSLTGNQTVKAGSSLQITLTPNERNHISSIKVNNEEKISEFILLLSLKNKANTISFNEIINDMTIEIVFENNPKITASLVVEDDEQNVAQINDIGETIIDYSSSKSYYASIYDDNFRIQKFVINGSDVFNINTYTFSDVVSDQTITVYVEKKTFKITSSVNTIEFLTASIEGGTISPLGETTVNYKNNQTYQIAPAQGYYVSALIIDGTRMDGALTHTFNNVNENHSIVAEFDLVSLTIEAIAGENGMADPTQANVKYGKSASFNIVANEFYVIDKILLDNVEIGLQSNLATYTYELQNIVENHEISILFDVLRTEVVPVNGIYKISNVAELLWVENELNNARLLTASFELLNNIPMESEKNISTINFEPMCNNLANAFAGTFDGKGFAINGLKIVSKNNAKYCGLFGYVASDATIKDLGINNCNINIEDAQQDSFVGAIAGYNNGTIVECYANGTIIANSILNKIYVGAISGYNKGIIEKCYNKCNISSSAKNVFAGGVVGYNNDSIAKITDCFNTANVFANSTEINKSFAGGIAGYQENGEINTCYNVGLISSSYSNGESGIAKDYYNNSQTKIYNCYYLNTSIAPELQQSCVGSVLNSQQIIDKANFVNFDFDNVWIMDNSTANLNNKMPVIKNVGNRVITASVNNSAYGTVLPVGQQVVEINGNQTFNFSAFTGKKIASIFVNGTQLNDSSLLSAMNDLKYEFKNVIEKNQTLSINFEREVYEITAQVIGGNGTITPSGKQTVYYEDRLVFVVSADEHYHLAKILIDNEEINFNLTQNNEFILENITKSADIKFYFELDKFEIEIISGEKGEIKGTNNEQKFAISNGSAIYEYVYGTNVQLSIVPNKNIDAVPAINYYIREVLIDGLALADFNKDGFNYTFENLSKNHSIKVVFAVYMISITASYEKVDGEVVGTISPEGITTAKYGSNVSYNIVPNEGYHIKDIVVDGVSLSSEQLSKISNIFTFENVKIDHTINVLFAKNEYTITIINENKVIKVFPETDVIYAQSGESKSITFDVPLGTRINFIKIDGSILNSTQLNHAIENGYIFKDITSNHTLEVVGEVIKFEIQATANTTNPRSGGTIDGFSTVNYGANAKYTFSPDANSFIIAIKIDNVALTKDELSLCIESGEYTFEKVTANHSIEVVYHSKNLNVEVLTNSFGSLKVNDELITETIIVKYNESLTFNILPNVGYVLSGIFVNDKAISVNALYLATKNNVYALENVLEDTKIKFEFEPTTFKVIFKTQEHGNIRLYNELLNETENYVNTSIINSLYYGDSIKAQAKPVLGYKFAGWSDGNEIVCTDAIISIDNVMQSAEYTATYEINQICFDVQFNQGGKVFIDALEIENGKHYFDYFTNHTFTFVPDEGFEINATTKDGEVYDKELAKRFGITFNNVQSDHSLEIEFKAKAFVISTNVGEYGKVFVGANEVNESLTVDYGTKLLFNIVPNEGYIVNDILINATSIGEPKLTTVKQNLTFELDTSLLNFADNNTIDFTFIVKSIKVYVNYFGEGKVYLQNNSNFENRYDALSQTSTIYFETSFGSNQELYIVPNGVKYCLKTIELNSSVLNAKDYLKNDGTYTFVLQNIMNTTVLNMSFDLKDCNINLSSNADNAGTISGGGVVKFGQNATISATENNGYKFVGWFENNQLVSDNKQYTFVAENDRNLVATYQVLISVSCEGNGKVEVGENSGLTSTYALPGSNLKLFAIENDKFYKFQTWKNGFGALSQLQITVGSDPTYYEAVFVKKTTVINVIISNGGTNNGTALSGVYSGGTINLNVLNSDADTFTFKGWSTDIGEGTFSSVDNLISTYLIADNDVINEKEINIYATFAVQNYSITVITNCNKGTGAIAVFADGTTVKEISSQDLPQTIYAIETNSHKFVNWTFSNDSLIGFSTSLTDTMLEITSLTGDVIVYANFNIVELTVVVGTLTENANGSAFLQGYDGTTSVENNYNLITYVVDYGSQLNINFLPNANYTLSKVILDGITYEYEQFASSIIDNTLIVEELTQNTRMILIFDTAKYSVLLSKNIEQAGEVVGYGMFDINSTVIVNALNYDNYQFYAWTKNGEIVSKNAEYSFAITENVELVAVFTVFVQLNCNDAFGSVEILQSQSGSGYFLPNTIIEINATPKNDYVKFVEWANTNISDAKYNLSISNEPITLEAIFANKVAKLYVMYGQGAQNEGTIEEYQVELNQTIDLSTFEKNQYYKFNNWEILQGSGTITNANEATTQFTVSNESIINESEIAITANFELVKFTITIENVNDYVAKDELGNDVAGGLYFENNTLTKQVTYENLYENIMFVQNLFSHTLINIEVVDGYISLNNNNEKYFITYIEGDVKLKAHFEIKWFNVNFKVNEFGTAQLNTDSYVKFGDSVNFTINPQARYTLRKVLLNNVELQNFEVIKNVFTFNNINEDCNFEFVFDLVQLHLTHSSNSEDACTFIGDGYYDQNELVTISLTANDGYEFQSMNINGVVTTSLKYSFVMTADTTIYLTFKVRVNVESDGNGSAIIGTEGNLQQVFMLPGSELKLTAFASVGYQFDNWGIGNYKTSPATVVVPNSKTTFVANFVSKLVDVSISASTNGSVDGSSENKNTYKIGDVLTLNAIGNEGFTFKNWSGTVDGVIYRSNANTTYTITDNDAERGSIVLLANFEMKSILIAISSTGDGSVSPKGNQFVDFGDSITITFTADQERELTSLLINGIESKNMIVNNTLTLENITENKTISATFDYLYWKNYATKFNGKGTEENPYLITNEREFAYVSLAINNGYACDEGNVEYFCAYYLVTNNMNFNGKIWTPIGLNVVDYWFDGTLNVNYKMLKNIDYDKSFNEVLYNGLIGTLGPNGKVINLAYGDLGLVAIIVGSSVAFIILIVVLIVLLKRSRRKKVSSNFSSSKIKSSKTEKNISNKPFNLEDYLKKK